MNKKSSQQGFSLIETLIVIAIMGIVLGMSFISFNQLTNVDEKQIIKRLQVALKFAAQQAHITGRAIKFEVTEQRYVFYRKNANGDWELIQDSRELRPYAWHRPIDKIQLSYTNKHVTPPLSIEFERASPTYELTIDMEQRRYVLEGRRLGDVHLNTGLTHE